MLLNTLFTETHTDDGITVIHISDLDRSRYCFAFPRRQGVGYDAETDDFKYTAKIGLLKASNYLSRHVSSYERKKLNNHIRLRYDELVK